MANLTINSIDLGNVILRDAEFNNDSLVFTGADTVLPGTILARSTASGNLVPYVIGGATDGNGVPVAVITYEVKTEGAATPSVRAMVSGEVILERLVVHADGDASNITNAIRDQLRNVSIVSVSSAQLTKYDNS